MKFLEELKEQRWDDHRFYHHSRINQSLHLISAMSFLGAYALLFVNPVIAAFLGWIVAMITRQIGHFFFEPKGYDEINQATHEHKENIKVGYNLKRKVVLLTIWGLSPIILYMNPTLFGTFQPYIGVEGYLHNLSIIWLVIAGGALIFRTIHLFFIYDVTAGLVWFTKILTDPFHDIKIYHKSPFYLLKGEFLDPMHHVK
ncbi:MAG: hypothetical protein PVF28_03560 [Thioalkalispiraceae bacterium]|jgi:hypothetical protein